MVCLPVPSASPSLIFSLVTLLAMLACVTTLLVVCALSVSLRHQKRDSHSAFEDDDVRENIISYDDEGGGEADTAAFDIAALQSMHRIQHIQNNSRNIWYTQTTAPRARTYSWSRAPRPIPDAQRPGSAPLYGRLCYGLQTLPHTLNQTLPQTLNQTLPVLRDYPAVGPLEAGVQLSQFTPGIGAGLSAGLSAGLTTGGRLRNSMVTPNHSTFETLLRSPQISSTIYEAEHTAEQSENKDGPGGFEGTTAEEKNQDKEQTQTAESDSAAVPLGVSVTYCDPTESYQSQTSSSSNAPEGRPGSSQTQISTSCTIDEFDTDSSISSVLEQGYSNGAPYGKSDTYSIVGSLNASSKAMNGTTMSGSSALYGGAGLPLLNVPPGVLKNSRPGNPQPLRMEELLNVRLNHVTFDLSQPPYDSLQTYEFEGRDSRAESLSSLESNGDKAEGSGDTETENVSTGGGMEELNEKFQKLVEIIRERQKERQQAETPDTDAAKQTELEQQPTPRFLDF